MTAAQLKDAIEETQSTRTLYRDLEVLQQAGFPLTNEGGCWRLLETSESSWAIPVNPTEVVALMLTEDLLAPVEGSWLAEPLANLRSRLSSTLTPTGRRYCAELRKANVATVFGSGHYGDLALVLGVNESVFPAAPVAPTILTDTDRDELSQRAGAPGPAS